MASIKPLSDISTIIVSLMLNYINSLFHSVVDLFLDRMSDFELQFGHFHIMLCEAGSCLNLF